MFHGVKKSEVKELTEEEKAKNEVQLKKLKAIQDQILKIKAKNKFDEKTMDFLLKSSVLMPDYPTLWSIRKILMEQKLPTMKDDEAMVQQAKHYLAQRNVNVTIEVIAEVVYCYVPHFLSQERCFLSSDSKGL